MNFCNEHQNVFLEFIPENKLRNPNNFVQRTALATVAPDRNSPNLHRRIATIFADYFHSFDADYFKVHLVEPFTGEFIIICPNNFRRELLVQQGSIWIDDNTEVVLHRWNRCCEVLLRGYLRIGLLLVDGNQES